MELEGPQTHSPASPAGDPQPLKGGAADQRPEMIDRIRPIPDDPMLPPYKDKCRCMSCGEYFNSSFGFEEHRSGKVGTPERRCLTPEELTAEGWAKNGTGHWISKPRPAQAPRRGNGVLTEPVEE